MKAGKKINYNLLRGRLPQYAKDDTRRTKQTFILVQVKKSEKEASKRADFLEKFNDVVKNKLKNGMCKAKRDPNRPYIRQNIIKKTCQNKIIAKGQSPGKEAIETTDYYICPVGVHELGQGTRLVEFNLQDPEVECKSSEKGQFRAGIGIFKTVNNKPVNAEIQKKTNDWFLVNHLDGSQLEGNVPCSSK